MDDLLKSLDALDLPEAVKAQIRALRPEPVANLDSVVRRLSLLRTFTERTFVAAAGDLSPVPSFDTFTAAASVEPLIGYPGRFAIVERVRGQQLAQWRGERDECARWARVLAAALDPTDAIDRMERYSLLFLSDQTAARRELQDGFEAADRANDIARCAALVELVGPIVQLFGDEESRSLLNDLRSRSQSRNLFFSEFYQSERYYPRPIDDEIRGFVHEADAVWIFHVHATGGMGKTTLLRRMVSHEWVIGPRHMPCAWLDFDYLDVGTVLQYPALLGLAMAAQWNEQLAQPVFGGILTPSFQPLASLLFRNRSDGAARGIASEQVNESSRARYRAGLSNPMRCGILAGAVPPRNVEERAQRVSQTPILLSYWADKLPEAVAAMPTDRPVLLVIDTLEDASLHHGQQLLEAIRLIAGLRQQARRIAEGRGQVPVNLRLILSGRHELGMADVPAFAKEFEGQYVSRALAGLEGEEARAFLVQELRPDAHPRRTALIDAIVGKSEGIPFNLSLFAEWANEDDTLDAETVRRSEDVSTVMLIERIVKRIPYQPLRWVIRYGVVPRALTLDFLRDVMREPLLEALSGRAEAGGLDSPDSPTERDVWTREPDFTFDAEALWNQHVVPYSSKRSWMMPGEHPQQVQFRSDILQPMRQLLRRQPVCEQLHERARAWYEKQATDPTTWSSATVEALYHAVQLRAIQQREAEDFLPAIQRILDAPLLAANPRLRATVCAELRKPDFSLLAPGEQAYVQYRLAEAIAAEHDYSYRTPAAVTSLLEAFDLQAGLTDTLPAFARVWKRAVDGTSVSGILGAFKDLSPDDVVRASLLLAELSGPGSQLVGEVLRGAVSIVAGLAASPIPLGVVASRLAQSVQRQDPEAAIRYYRMAADDFGARGDETRRASMLRLASETELALGLLARAERTLADASIEHLLEVRVQLARVELAKGNPGEALGLLHGATSPQQRTQSLDVLITEAEALSQRMLLREAADAWERASRHASQQANSAALTQIAVGQARFYYGWLGAMPATAPGGVASLLERARAMGTSAGGDPLVSEIEVWQIVTGQADAERSRRRALGEITGDSPTARIRVTLALAQVVPSFPVRRLLEMADQARQLVPSARVAALAEPVLQGDPPAFDAPVRAVAEAFEYEPESDIEWAWYAIRHGELLAWLGFHEEAADLLARRVPLLDASAYGQGWRPAVYRQRRRVEQRIRDWQRRGGATRVFPAPDPDPVEVWWDFWRHTPFRAAVALVENAQRAFDAGDLALMDACLERATSGLALVPFETVPHATARRLRSTAQDAPHGRGVRVPHAAVPMGSTSAGPADASSAGATERLGGPHFTVVEMREQSGRVAVRTESPPREQVLSAESRTLEVLLRSRGIPRRLVGMPLELIAEELSDIVTEAGIDRRQRIALSIPLSPLSSAPWELTCGDATLLPFRLPSRWTETEAAGELGMAVEAVSELPPPEPVIFQPMSPQDKESPAISCYVALGARVRRRLDELRGDVAPASALYVASSLMEMPGINEPALAGTEWTASTLAHVIATSFGDVRPFVVLDVPAPVTSADVVHQLLLRNYFAQALTDAGVVAGVLATGLHPVSAMGNIQELVLERLGSLRGSRLELFDAVAALARTMKLMPHDALFTAVPHALLPARRPRYA
jgi:tetratricopeptide (TPR) repeat protein